MQLMCVAHPQEMCPVPLQAMFPKGAPLRTHFRSLILPARKYLFVTIVDMPENKKFTLKGLKWKEMDRFWFGFR